MKANLCISKLAAAAIAAAIFVILCGFEVRADATYSINWVQDEKGSWHVRNKNYLWVKDAWVCDDAVAANGKDVWYLVDSDGNLICEGLVQDQTGNYYSLETDHNGYYGMLRYRSGTYDGIPLVLESAHNGAFAAIKNQAGIDALKAKYGLKTVNISNENIVYTSNEPITQATTEGWAKYANGTWYFYENQERVKGWKEIDGVHYYFNKTNGAMLVNTYTPDGYYVGADGAWDGKAANSSKVTSTSTSKTGSTSGTTAGKSSASSTAASGSGTSSGSSASGPGNSASSGSTASGSSSGSTGSSTGPGSSSSSDTDTGKDSETSGGSSGPGSGTSTDSNAPGSGTGKNTDTVIEERQETEPEWDKASAEKLSSYAAKAKTALQSALSLYQEGQNLTETKDIIKKYNQACGKACGIIETLSLMETLAEERPAVTLTDGTVLTRQILSCETLAEEIGNIMIDTETDLESASFKREMNKISTLYDKMTAIEELARSLK